MFLLIGCIVYVVDVSLAWLMLRINGFSVSISVTIAYIVGVITHFFLNNKLTFSDSSLHWGKKLRGYILVLVINYCITLVTVQTILAMLIDNIIIAKSIAALITAVTGYWGMRNIAFVNNQSSSDK